MKIYCDLDGVLTDFVKKLCETLGKPLDRSLEPGNDPKVWKKIDGAGEEFWSTMEWMPGGDRLWEELKKYNPTILTAPSRHESSYEGKKKWLDKNLPGVPFIIEEKKDKYAAPDAILIDDREKNIDAWEKAGGIGLLHKDTGESLKKLSEIMSKMNNKKKACISVVLKTAAFNILGGKFDTQFQEFLKTFDPNKPSMMGEYSPSPNKSRGDKVEYLFEDPNPAKARLTLNVLNGLFNRLEKEGKPINRGPKSNLRNLINLLADNQRERLSESQKEDLRREIRQKALDIFPAGHPLENLNMDIMELVFKAMNKKRENLTSLANKINPRPEIKGEIPRRPSLQTLKWAMEKIVKVASEYMEKKIAMKPAKSETIITQDGRKVVIPKDRGGRGTQTFTPKKGPGSYKRDKDWKKYVN